MDLTLLLSRRIAAVSVLLLLILLWNRKAMMSARGFSWITERDDDGTLIEAPSDRTSRLEVNETSNVVLSGFDKRFEDLRKVLETNGCLDDETAFNRRVGVLPPRRATTTNDTATPTQLQYIHVPKTGGTTIQVQLREWIRTSGMRGRIHMLTLNGGDAKCPPRVRSYSVLAGHRGYGFCRGLAATPPVSFVVLRSPLARMISLFDYNRETRETSRAVHVFGNKSFSALIKKYDATPNATETGESLIRYSATQQARFLCGYDCLNGNGMDAEEMLRRAIRNLKRVEIVGITEKLNDVIPQLKHHGLAWVDVRSRNRFPTKLNKIAAYKKSELDSEAKEILRRWARVDIELYELAKEIAQRKTAEARRCLAGFDKIPFVVSRTGTTDGGEEKSETEETMSKPDDETSNNKRNV